MNSISTLLALYHAPFESYKTLFIVYKERKKTSGFEDLIHPIITRDEK